MAFLGDMFIAGSEHLDGKYKSGVAFSISRKSPLDFPSFIRHGLTPKNTLLHIYSVIHRMGFIGL
jgi:hypothetical protein